ncbi:MAG: type II CRISPR-associated endonuclease Cas1 [Flavobacteriaceae bacterium]|nr:type II CRISPR-associated endonuclease Cas1 [Flavobacteriaceae bacterium]
MLKRSIFIGNKSSISTKLNQLLIKTEEKEATIPIEDIGFLVIENQETYISIPALDKLTENNVAVIFCNNKHLPSSMLLNLDTHYIQQEVFAAQIKASEPLKKQLWRQTVKAKIHNQMLLLQNQQKDFKVLEFHKSKTLSGDSDNREAMAAAHYWKNLFNFQFKRERNGQYPNLFLNYGYTILRAATARALSGSGLLNTIGIHHRNKYNAFCLADDIMEPYRPWIDAKVIQIVNNFHEQELTTAIKAKLLETLTDTVFFKNSKSPLMVGLSKTTASLQQCFMGTETKIKYPKLWN